MLVSYKWLQSYFKKDLPKPEKLANLLTMHSLEVDGIEKKKGDYVLDINVTPNRAHDCLSHEGIAREIATILDSKLKIEKLKIKNYKLKTDFNIEVKELALCRRYASVMVEGVKVKSSPKWLRDRLEAIGQKSINNIVDILNFVMFDVGQPMHAFDADKVKGSIVVRKAKAGEKITTLNNQEVELDESILVIADDVGPLALAGVKGGNRAGVDNGTRNIILEAANFEPVNIRKTSRRVGIRNDSSVRFENEISPILAEGALEMATGLILKEAGGKNSAVKDFYPRKVSQYKLGIHPKDVSSVLGIDIPENNIINIFVRLGFEVKKIKPIDNVIKIAQSLKGKPYKYGASVSYDAPEFFDCSSFVSYVFAHSGVQVPRMTIDQYFYGKPVDKKDLKVGDLVFSNTGNGKIHYETKDFMKGNKVKEGIDHCGMYMGKGKVIHSSRYNSSGIIVEDLNKSKQFKKICGFRRMVAEEDDLLLVTVPPARLDIRIKEDLVEEVGRIYGYENIPSVLPHFVLSPAVKNENYELLRKIKDIFVGAGFSEVYNYSFVKRGDIELENPIARGREFLRSNLAMGLLSNIEENLKYFDEVKVFEAGEVFRLIKNEKCVDEKTMIGGALAYKDKKKNKEHEVFYEIKGVLSTLFEKLGILGMRFSDDGEETALIKYDDKIIGYISNFSDHGEPVLGWEIDFEKLKDVSNQEREYSPASRYPSAVRDLSVFIPFRTKVEEVLDVIENTAGELLFDTDLFDIYENDERKSFAFRLVFQSYDKTLSEGEINELMNKIIKALDEKTEWEVRKIN